MCILLWLSAYYVNMLILRFVQPSEVNSRLAVTSSCSDFLKGKVCSWPSEHVKGEERDMPCISMIWQHHPAVIFLTNCLLQCLWLLLGKKEQLCCRVYIVEGKVKGRRKM